jgi:hypothetical protein
VTIDVVQALELFEICADEMASEDAGSEFGRDDAGRRRLSLTARALAKRELSVAHLSRFPLRGSLDGAATPAEPTMTLGALIVFRTADRFVRAGASTTRTLEAVYRAVQRYLEIIPSSLQDGADRAAIGRLISEPRRSVPLSRCQRPSTFRHPLTESWIETPIQTVVRWKDFQ